MKKRPLCYVCLVFLLIKSVLLLLTGGQSGGLSADSIFRLERKRSHLAGAGISKDEHIKDADLISKKQFYKQSK